MADLKAQILHVKFWFNLPKTATGTCEMLQKAFCVAAMSRTQTCEWYSHFRSGQNLVEGFEEDVQAICHQKTDENVEKVQHQAIHTDKWHMINCVCNILGLSHGTC
jgi:hypothetical protein